VPVDGRCTLLQHTAVDNGKGVEFPPGVSRVLKQIETKFGRLSSCLGVKLFNGANADIVGHTVQPEIQDGGSKTEVPISRAVYGTKY
jgi:hypothetical protein